MSYYHLCTDTKIEQHVSEYNTRFFRLTNTYSVSLIILRQNQTVREHPPPSRTITSNTNFSLDLPIIIVASECERMIEFFDC
jgi:hypothetical protein